MDHGPRSVRMDRMGGAVTATSVRVERLGYALGARIHGADLARTLDDETFERIRRAFLDHCVLVFRGQSLTREQQIAFTRRFGEVGTHEQSPKHDDPAYP